MKTLISSLLVIATSAALMAAFPFSPLTTPPPTVSDIGEIQFDRSDVIINGDKYISIPRDAFLRFFSDGVFSVDFKTMDKIRFMPREIDKDGGQIICSGHFATKDGRIYSFCRYTQNALEISDSTYGTGWFLLPE